MIFERSDRTYGSPRLYRALVRRGYPVSHRRVERLMRQAHWRARGVRVYRRTAGTHLVRAASQSRARAGDHVAVFAIDTIDCLAGTLPVAQRRLVEAWAEIHRAELQADWDLLQSGQPPVKIEPLR